MLKRLVLIAVVLLPGAAVAADLVQPRRVRHGRVPMRQVEANRVVHCTTSRFLLFTYANCGQDLDPFASAAN